MWGSGQGMPPAFVPFGNWLLQHRVGRCPPSHPSPCLGWLMGRRNWSCSCHGRVPALPCSREQLGRLWPRYCQPGSAGAAEPATSPAPGRLKESSAPAAAAGGAGWRSKTLPFSQAQALASPRLGPSATASVVESGLSLAQTPGLELWLCGRGSADHGGTPSMWWGWGCAGGRGRGALGSLLRSGHCSWCRRGVLCVRGRAEAGLGCSLVCTGAWS